MIDLREGEGRRETARNVDVRRKKHPSVSSRMLQPGIGPLTWHVLDIPTVPV